MTEPAHETLTPAATGFEVSPARTRRLNPRHASTWHLSQRALSLLIHTLIGNLFTRS